MKVYMKSQLSKSLTIECQNLLEFSSLLLAIAEEVSELTGVDVVLNVNQKPLVELKGARELLHQLPDTLKELVDYWRDFFWVTIQISISIKHSILDFIPKR